MDEGVLLIRVVLGLTLAAHGHQKIFRGGRIEGTARWFDSMGMKPNGRIHAWLAACTEIGAGLLFAVGLLTPLAAAGFVGLMLVAAWTVHRPNGFFSVRSGWEFNLVLGVVPVGVAMVGPGRWSLDHALDLSFHAGGAGPLGRARARRRYRTAGRPVPAARGGGMRRRRDGRPCCAGPAAVPSPPWNARLMVARGRSGATTPAAWPR